MIFPGGPYQAGSPSSVNIVGEPWFLNMSVGAKKMYPGSVLLFFVTFITGSWSGEFLKSWRGHCWGVDVAADASAAAAKYTIK